MFVQLITINFMNVDKVPSKNMFAFKPTFAHRARKLGLTTAIVLQVNRKGGLMLIGTCTLAARERAFLESCLVGTVF